MHCLTTKLTMKSAVYNVHQDKMYVFFSAHSARKEKSHVAKIFIHPFNKFKRGLQQIDITPLQDQQMLFASICHPIPLETFFHCSMHSLACLSVCSHNSWPRQRLTIKNYHASIQQMGFTEPQTNMKSRTQRSGKSHL